MKNIAGIIIGFLAGAIGFMAFFKIFFLDRIPREDELAPGIVVTIAITIGSFCGFVGSVVQEFFRRERN